MIKSNHRLKSIDLVEMCRPVVESSKMDPSRSKFDRFQVSNDFCEICNFREVSSNLVNLVILMDLLNFVNFLNFVEFYWI